MRVLFVCLGNICRSPAAHTAFESAVREAGLSDRVEVDSCGTGDWHRGDLADPRMRATAKRHGEEITHRARQIRPEDLEEFDRVFVMDRQNRKDVLRLARTDAQKAKVSLFREWDPDRAGEDEVPDPYNGGPEDFEAVWAMVTRASEAFVKDLVARKSV